MLDRIVQNLFDYAGMFPPAKLDFNAMLHESAAFPRTLARPHIVSADLVIEREYISQLNDDTLLNAGFAQDHHVKACIVGVPANEAHDAFDRIRAFHNSAHDAKVPRRVVALEISDERTFEEDLPGAVHNLRQLALRATGLGIALYYEPRWDDQAWQEGLGRVIRLLKETAGEGRPPVGLKARCAGPTAVAPRTLAGIIASVADAHLPLKLTQGLHHPIVEPYRSDNPIGFLGCVVAHRLRGTLGPSFDLEIIHACVTEQDKDAFGFTEGVRYKDVRVDAERIARSLAVPLNIGSCSLSEPDEDLVRLFGGPA